MNFLLIIAVTMIVSAIGLSIGSFLNVVIYRLPANLSLVHPPSRCPQCFTRLKKRENVPVFGWIFLKGRCAHCQCRISIRYPLIEAITGVLFVIVFLTFGISMQTFGYWIFLSVLLALAIIDLDTMTLPNPLTQTGLIAGLIFQAIIGFLTNGIIGAVYQLMIGIIGTVIGIWLLDAIAIVGSTLLGQAAMGAGDSKLMAMMGAWLGWKLMLIAGFFACAIGVAVGGGAIALGLLSRRQPMPFGPFLALGAALSLFFGNALLSSYLRLFVGLQS